uniref:Uncharacterized protein n=1 Tax=Plectus sambesii TaxID=2011161 RepID=A0A914WZ43_9BILA
MSLYHPVGARQKDVSTRLIKPTLPDIHLDVVLQYVHHWDPTFELDGSIAIYDEGIAQYLLCDIDSHHKFYAALILNKPSLRCTLTEEEPDDVLDASSGNRFDVMMPSGKSLPLEDAEAFEVMKDKLQRRGYKF